TIRPIDETNRSVVSSGFFGITTKAKMSNGGGRHLLCRLMRSLEAFGCGRRMARMSSQPDTEITTEADQQQRDRRFFRLAGIRQESCLNGSAALAARIADKLCAVDWSLLGWSWRNR